MFGETLHPAMERMYQSALSGDRCLVVPGLSIPSRPGRPPKPSVWVEAAHEFHELAYVDDGACTIVMERQAHRISAGGICIIPAGTYHYETPVGATVPYTTYWIRLRGAKVTIHASRYAAEQRRLVILGGHTSPASSELKATFAAIHQEILRKEPLAERVLRGYLIVLAGLIHRQCRGPADASHGDHPDEIVRKALGYLQSNLHRSDLTIGEVARHVALNLCYFIEYFKERMGCTPYRYLLNRRMERARDLLLQTEWSVARIADAVGFSSPARFSTAFKQFNKVPPSEFRRMHGVRSCS